MHYLLFYDYVPDIMEKRDAYRKDHLALAWEYQERGQLILAGVLTDPVDAAVLFFEADSPKVVEAFVRADPYVKGGLVTRWQVRGWNTVVGDAATNPVRP